MATIKYRNGIVRSATLLVVGLVATFAVPTAVDAQQAVAPNSVAKAAAPIPPQILAAKKAFISNAGTDAESRTILVDKEIDVNSAYEQFYAAMNGWKRFELVAAPADADVVLEISFTSPEHDCNRGPCEDPQLTVVVYDARTHFRLWTLTERIESAILASTWKKNFSTAVESLVLDFKQLTNSPS